MSAAAGPGPARGPVGPDEFPAGLALVTSAAGKRRNVMAANRIACVAPEPMVFALAVHRDRYTHGLIKESGEFVINVISRAQADVTRRAGQQSGRNMDKFAVYGLETKPATHVSPPLIVGCASSMECKVIEAVELGDRTIFLAKMLALHINEGIRPLISYHHLFCDLGEAIPSPG